MNMKTLSISSLILIASFVNYAGREKVNMSRIYAAKKQAQKEFNQIKNARKVALEKLFQTEKGKIYKQKEALCDRLNNCDDCPDFLQASKDLRATEVYENEFLPAEKTFMYHDWKLFGLEKMTRYVEAKVDYTDINAMYSGLNSALYIDARPNSDLASTRDQVYDELASLIAAEKYELIDAAMPAYQ